MFMVLGVFNNMERQLTCVHSDQFIDTCTYIESLIFVIS